MKPRVRPISNLYHRYGKKSGLDAEDITVALKDAGYIKLLDGDKYQEIEKPKVSKEEYEEFVYIVLKYYREKTYGRP